MWGSIIAAGIGYLGSKKASKASQAAADRQAEALQEAAKPRSVYDPLGAAVYNPVTDSYELMTSPELAQLQQGLFYDAMRQRQEVEPYMTRGGFESEVSRRSREEENLIKEATREALQDVQGKLLKRGTLGTTMGAGSLAEVARKGAEAGIAARQAQRGLLSGEITDALNRAQAARQGMVGVGQYPQSLATIGQGLSANALGAAQSASPMLQSAANMNIQAGMQPYAQLSGMLSGLSRQNYMNKYGQNEVPSWASWL